VVGDNTLTADVFVTCCEGDFQIIKATVRAIAVVNWPSECFRVIVFDDGADSEVKTAITELSMLYRVRAPNARIQPMHALTPSRPSQR
jgi:hypothetical protein